MSDKLKLPSEKEIERMAALNKKTVTVSNAVKYGNFLRVYFTLDRLRITEQWNNKESGDNG